MYQRQRQKAGKLLAGYSGVSGKTHRNIEAAGEANGLLDALQAQVDQLRILRRLKHLMREGKETKRGG